MWSGLYLNEEVMELFFRFGFCLGLGSCRGGGGFAWNRFDLFHGVVAMCIRVNAGVHVGIRRCDVFCICFIGSILYGQLMQFPDILFCIFVDLLKGVDEFIGLA